MVVGQSGAHLQTVLTSVKEVFNTDRDNVTIQSKFGGNIGSKPVLSNSVCASVRHNPMMPSHDVRKVNSSYIYFHWQCHETINS